MSECMAGAFFRHAWKINWLCRVNHHHDTQQGCPHVWVCQSCGETGYSVPEELLHESQ